MRTLFIQHPKFALLFLFAVALVASMLVFMPTLEIAKRKQIVDNPNARKLQKNPVPILGGVVIFFGISVGLMFFKTIFYHSALLPVLAAMVTMLYIGTIDDIIDLSARFRIIAETAVAALLIYGSRSCIMNFQGLWGIETLPVAVAVPLTVLMIVGVTNALNMIDGIDGLLSGMGILACTCLGVLAFLGHDYSTAALAAVTVGSLTTFLLHNVFGWDSKMFLGDGGSMLLGIIVSWMIIATLCGHFHLAEYRPMLEMSFSLIAFVLASVAIPVGDTLRVMAGRIVRGKSPFEADNTHLHHMFLRMGFSHIGTTICMTMMNAIIVAAMLVSWRSGVSIDGQLYIVILVTALLDGGTALLFSRHEGRDGKTARAIRAVGRFSHVERKGFWLWLQKIIDR